MCIVKVIHSRECLMTEPPGRSKFIRLEFLETYFIENDIGWDKVKLNKLHASLETPSGPDDGSR